MSAVWTGTGTPPDPVDGLPADDLTLQRMIEAGTDVLMDECQNLDVAKHLVTQHDLNDDPATMAALYQAIAEWDGTTASAVSQFKKLHNLMADQMQAIATKEAEKWQR